MSEPRLCEVCGARVRNMNPLVTTCDAICTRAKYNQVDRPKQIRIDIAQEEADERLGFWNHSEFLPRAADEPGLWEALLS